jgi:hypothetical protein
MADDFQHGDGTKPRVQHRKRLGPIRVLPPDVVPMTKEDKQQAVAAISAMIAAWWHEHQHDPDE